MDNIESTMPADTDKGAPAAPGFSSTAITTLRQIDLYIKVIKELYAWLEQGIFKNERVVFAVVELLWKTSIQKADELFKDWSKNVSAITDTKERELIDAALNTLQEAITSTQQAQTELSKNLVEKLKHCRVDSRVWEPQGNLYLNGLYSIVLFVAFSHDIYYLASDPFSIQCYFNPETYIFWSTLSGYFICFVMMKLKPLNDSWYAILSGILYALLLGALFVFPFLLGLNVPLIHLIADQANFDFCSVTLFKLIVPNLHWYKALAHLLGIVIALIPRAEFLRRESYKAKPYTESINTLQYQKHVSMNRFTELVKQLRSEVENSRAQADQ